MSAYSEPMFSWHWPLQADSGTM